MSFSFYINSVPKIALKATLDLVAMPNLVCDEGIPDDGWPEIAHIYQDDVSVRSIETSFDGANLQVRIMANSSLDDFKLAFSIVEQASIQFDAMIIPEATESDLDEIDLVYFRNNYGDSWQKDQCLTYLNMMIGMVRENADAKLTIFGTRAEFVVGNRMISSFLEDKSTFAKKFFAAFRRKNYLDREDLFFPSVISLEHNDTGKIAKMSVLVQKAQTVLSSDVPFLELTNADVLAPKPVEEYFKVRFDSFVEAAKEHIVWVDEETVITPDFSDDDWKSITSKLSEQEVDFFADDSLLVDVSESSSHIASINADESTEDDEVLGFTQEQWGLVSALPMGVFVMIAGADGVIDKKEVESFQSQLIVGMVGDSEIFQLAIMTSLSNFEIMIEKMIELDFEGVAQFISLSYEMVKQNHGVDEVNKFGQALFDLAKSVAESSGGGFLGFGSKIGKEEKAVLKFLKTFFELN